jgi:hypothetical protein
MRRLEQRAEVALLVETRKHDTQRGMIHCHVVQSAQCRAEHAECRNRNQALRGRVSAFQLFPNAPFIRRTQASPRFGSVPI